ncbi:cell division protein FtsQ/DivIB [Georgenia sp. TF02-10]|uniref:cell division protein FtsQ/DivIB n=1 Tax=Georgenia sp. TF02-10 TaxID=2917725 RepID=UPI001FA772C2|nr:cell division protein FtsQ/DivIB [Georgenia sp. TF02-10]UNX55980.1 cell division protein FtsQ/DivIB [Georgenia sp. TF02-10]
MRPPVTPRRPRRGAAEPARPGVGGTGGTGDPARGGAGRARSHAERSGAETSGATAADRGGRRGATPRSATAGTAPTDRRAPAGGGAAPASRAASASGGASKVRGRGASAAPARASTDVVPVHRPAAPLAAPRTPTAGEVPVVSTGLAARAAEREAAARHLRRRRILLALAGLAAVAALAWVLLLSPLLAVRPDQVEVTGAAGPVDPADVHAVAEPAVGVPLLRVDTGALADQVASITGVKEARVARSWPNGLTVAVVSRIPVAAVQSDGGWVLVDGDGVQVAESAEQPADLPVVSVPLTSSEETAPAVTAVLKVLDVLPAELLADVAEAGATSADQVVLTLQDGATVRWGSAEEGEFKAAVLQVLRQEPAKVYDVSIPRSPTTSQGTSGVPNASAGN